MIVRNLEKVLLSHLKTFPAVAILGARQVGKTTLSKIIANKINRRVISIDLEDPRDMSKLENGPYFFEANQDKCIIIDEIQRNPEVFVWLRPLIDKNRVPGRFIILGSASPVILKKATESLAGRIVYLELSGIKFNELPDEIEMKTHWLRGGFPTLLLTSDANTRNAWCESFLKSYTEIDLPSIGLRLPPLFAQRMINMIAHIHGSMWNAESLGRSLGVKGQNLRYYRDFLEKTYFLRVLPPFFSNAKKKIVKTPKIYFRDTGMLHYLSRIDSFNTLFGHPIVGNSWEGYVVEQVAEFLKEKQLSMLEVFFYRTREGTECDLVIADNIHPLISIEMKIGFPKTYKGLTNAINDLGTKHNFIVSPDAEGISEIKPNVFSCGIKELLSQLKILLKK